MLISGCCDCTRVGFNPEFIYVFQLRLKMSRTLDTIQFDRLETVQQTSASIGILAGEPTDEVPLDVQV